MFSGTGMHNLRVRLPGSQLPKSETKCIITTFNTFREHSAWALRSNNRASEEWSGPFREGVLCKEGLRLWRLRR